MSSGVDFDFGRVHAGRICGEDARFVDERQFTLRKGGDAWVIVANANVKNATFLNGTAVIEETELKENDEISLQSKAAFIRITFA